jgi:two-component system KDP operon response regulator KdpE
MTVVAVIDPDEQTRRRLVRTLEAGELITIEASDGLEALRTTFASRPNAAVVDLQTTGIDGLELVRVMRAACDMPIIAVSPPAMAQLTVRALDAGADDVIERNCSATEILARVRAAIRRYQRRPAQDDVARQVATGALVIDREAQTVTKHGDIVQLTRTEYRLLDALSARLGEVAPHRYLLSTVWGDAYVDDTHYLRVYIGYLRQKLEDESGEPRYLLNEWGMGYRLARLPVEGADVTSAEAPAAMSRLSAEVTSAAV